MNNNKWQRNFDHRPGMFRRGDYSRNRGCAIACIVGLLFWFIVIAAIRSCTS